MGPISEPTLIAQSQPSEQGSSRSATASRRVKSKPEANLDDSNESTNQQQPLMREQDSTLPSTVPESLDVGAEGYALPAIRKTRAQTKMSQHAVTDGTQEISQEGMTTFLNERVSRSALDQPEEKTQQTYQDGDTGAVDFSSYAHPPDHDEIVEPESEPVAFSPSPLQTQKHVSQFPESQRFARTPATIARKRDYNGNTKDTPLEPRRPRLRSQSQKTPSNAMGMSQIFAQTQAATSPLEDQIAEPTSDRPSPDIALEAKDRPIQSLSSPLQRLQSSDFLGPRSPTKPPRSSAEPATTYLRMRASQERRKLKEMEEKARESDSDASSDSDFCRPQRPLKGRKNSSRNTRAVSERREGPSRVPKRPATPIKSSSRPTSPRTGQQPATTSLGRPVVIESDEELSPTANVSHHHPASEEDTDIEDEEAALQRSSQHISYDPEDKENHRDGSIQIPQTTFRPSRMTEIAIVDLEASPSVRRRDMLTAPLSDGPIVANSQPSQPVPFSQRPVMKSSSTSGPDFVPQSQIGSGQQTESSAQTHIRRIPDSSKPPQPSPPDSQDGDALEDKQLGIEMDQEHQADVVGLPPQQDKSSSPPPIDTHVVNDAEDPDPNPNEHTEETSVKPSTVAETSSTQQPAQLLESNAASEPNKPTHSNSAFETAPDVPQPTTQPELESSQPVVHPGGKKRKRNMPNFTEPETPTQEKWSQIFDANEALGNAETELLADESPMRPPKRQKFAGQSLEIAETITSTTANAVLISSSTLRDEPDELLRSQPAVRPRRVRPVPSARPAGPTIERQSTWDVEVTPSPQKPMPRTKPAETVATRSGRNMRSTQRQADNGQQSEPAPPDAHENPPTQTETPLTTPTKAVEQRETSVEMATSTHDTTTTDTYRTAPTGEVTVPNVVFACFNGKTRAYYPARCLAKNFGGQHYTVQWDGFNPDEVGFHGIRRLELRVGDLLKIEMPDIEKIPYIVRGFKDQITGQALEHTLTDQYGFSTIIVAPKQRKSMVEKATTSETTKQIREVPVSAIYLDSNMWNQMKDREYSFSATNTSHMPGYATPAEGSSTPASPASRVRRQGFTLNIPFTPTQTTGLLAGCVFVISYENEVRRRELTRMLKAHGATLLDEYFTEMFEQDTTILRSKFGNSGFTTLLADKHSRKPKYLQALALGLPCLSGKWIEACITASKLVDWHKYLLPAGECEQLEGAARSRIMPPLEPADAKLVGMLMQRSLILQGKKVLVVTGKTAKAEAKMRNHLFFVKATGAKSVITVADAKAAKALLDDPDGDGNALDIVYVDSLELGAAEAVLNKVERANTVGKKKGRRAKRESEMAAEVQRNWKVLGTESLVQSLILGELVD